MAPVVTSFTPALGNSSGDTLVTITGTGFTADAVTNRVMVGVNEGTIVGTPTTTQIVFRTPAGTPSTTPKIMVLDVVAGTSGQSSATFAYNAVATLETLVSQLARKWKVDIDVSVAQDGTNYIPVRALSSVKANINSTNQDDSDYDSNGWGSDIKTMMKWSLELGLIRKIGVTSLTYDPGQEAIRAAATLFGTTGTVRVRWYDRNGGPEAYYGFASVAWAPDGGDTTKLETVSVSLSGQGLRNTIANPNA
jgi:hypothetical protein